MAHEISRDYIAFQRAGLADEYETAGKYSLFMVCESPNTSAFKPLPNGYSFRLCRRDELEIWKRVVAEEKHVSYVSDFYNRVYAKNKDEFFRRCTFVCNADGKPVASCFIWRSYGQINTIGWTRTLPEYEGLGLGSALLGELLKTARYPIYLHTQPTSVCALKLYSDLGFALIKAPSIIGHRKNGLTESLPYMQKTMNKKDYANLKFVEADHNLHKAASSSKFSEF
jgi:GNAT superfamily N-acetyltransferase